jgi:hypothetical protein
LPFLQSETQDPMAGVTRPWFAGRVVSTLQRVTLSSYSADLPTAVFLCIFYFPIVL